MLYVGDTVIIQIFDGIDENKVCSYRKAIGTIEEITLDGLFIVKSENYYYHVTFNEIKSLDSLLTLV